MFWGRLVSPSLSIVGDRGILRHKTWWRLCLATALALDLARRPSSRDLVHRTLPYCVILEEIDEFADVDTMLKKSPARLLLEDFIAIRDPDAVGKQYYTAVRIYQRQASKLAAVSRNRSPS